MCKAPSDSFGRALQHLLTQSSVLQSSSSCKSSICNPFGVRKSPVRREAELVRRSPKELCNPFGLQSTQTSGLQSTQTEGIAKQSFAQEICKGQALYRKGGTQRQLRSYIFLQCQREFINKVDRKGFARNETVLFFAQEIDKLRNNYL